MKIKFFGCILCLCSVAAISDSSQSLVSHRLAPKPLFLKSYITPYYMQAVFRATEPAPRTAFLALSDEEQAQENLNLRIIDSVIVIPIAQKV